MGGGEADGGGGEADGGWGEADGGWGEAEGGAFKGGSLIEIHGIMSGIN